jgi:glycosyltransferase involved in cell wall biosynthesis
MKHFAAGQAVVLFSTAEWFWPYWTNKQHIAARLGARGFRVLYVESIGFRRPGLNTVDLARIWRRVRRAAGPIRQVQRNVWVLPPLTIPGSHHLAWADRFNAWQLWNRIDPWLRQVDSDRPIVWTYHPYMLRIAKALDPAALVYHCVDNIGAIPGIDGAAFGRAERELLANADRIFATSTVLRDRSATIAPTRTDYFGNVADIEHFATARHDGPVPADLAAVPRPRLAYMGVLSDFKIDLELVDHLVARRPDWHLVFIGDEPEGQNSAAMVRLRTRPNVHFLGWKPYAQLPSYLRGIDVALLPQRINDYTRAMFPMKYFEYLAAGMSVVATPLPALAGFTALHRQADTREAFVDAIAGVLAAPVALPIDHPTLQSHSWEARIDAMLDGIAAMRGAKSIPTGADRRGAWW